MLKLINTTCRCLLYALAIIVGSLSAVIVSNLEYNASFSYSLIPYLIGAVAAEIILFVVYFWIGLKLPYSSVEFNFRKED